MLHITIPEREFFDEETNEFFSIKRQSLVMEHSLISISKWEAKWKKPYFSDDKTAEEIIDYFRCMVVSPQKFDPIIFRTLDS